LCVCLSLRQQNAGEQEPDETRTHFNIPRLQIRPANSHRPLVYLAYRVFRI
jgi:hypothetical protein